MWYHNAFLTLLMLMVISFLAVELAVTSPAARKDRVIVITSQATTSTTTITELSTTTALTTTTPLVTTTAVPTFPINITCPVDLVLPLGSNLDPLTLQSFPLAATGGCSFPLGITNVQTVLQPTVHTGGYEVTQSQVIIRTVLTAAHSANYVFTVDTDHISQAQYIANMTQVSARFLGLVALPQCNFSATTAVAQFTVATSNTVFLTAFLDAASNSSDVCLVQVAVDTNTVDTSLLTFSLSSLTSLKLGVSDDFVSMTLADGAATLCVLNRTWPHAVVRCNAAYTGLLGGFNSTTQKWTPLVGLSSPTLPGAVFYRAIDDEYHPNLLTKSATVDYIEVEHWTTVTSTTFNPVRYRIAVAEFDSNITLASQTLPYSLDNSDVSGCHFRAEKQSVTLAFSTRGGLDTRWIELRWLPPSNLVGPQWVLYQQGTLTNATRAAISADALNSIMISASSAEPQPLMAYRIDSDTLGTTSQLYADANGLPANAGPATVIFPQNVAAVLPSNETTSTFVLFVGPVARDFPYTHYGGQATLVLDSRIYTRTWKAYDQCFDEDFCNQTLTTVR